MKKHKVLTLNLIFHKKQAWY